MLAGDLRGRYVCVCLNWIIALIQESFMAHMVSNGLLCESVFAYAKAGSFCFMGTSLGFPI